MIITLFRFNKRENSTKRPALTDGANFNCVLKEATSVVSPAVVINFNQKTQFNFDYNYAYIAEFHRYYFIEDMVSDGFAWVVHLKSDVLATFRTTIGNANLYIMRSSIGYDGNLVDNYYPVSVARTSGSVFHKSPWIHSTDDTVIMPDIDTDGMYVVGVASKYGHQYGSFGAIDYVGIRPTEFYILVRALMENTIITANGFNLDDASLELQKSIIDPLSFIKSCIWVPLLPTASCFAAESQSLNVFDWTVSVPNRRVIQPQLSFLGGIQLPKHPKAATKGSYLNAEPYTRMSLFFPPFGQIDLDTAVLANSPNLRYDVCIDPILGKGNLKLYAESDVVMIASIDSQIGVPIQLSQTYNDYISSFIQASRATGDVFSLQFGSAAENAIGSAVTAMKPITSSVGSNGSFAALKGNLRLYYQFYDIPPEDRDHVGRPLCESHQPATYGTGYYKCLDGDVEIGGYASEQMLVKEYLEGGFYYE